MEDLIELILELALEGGLEVTKNDKVPKYIRYIILVLLQYFLLLLLE